MIHVYRRRAYTVHAVQWRGEENCEEVFAFLGLDHPDDELDHDCIHFETVDGRIDTLFPGDWAVSEGHGPERWTNERFHAAFEAYDTSEEHEQEQRLARIRSLTLPENLDPYLAERLPAILDGNRRPTSLVLALLAEHAGVGVDWLLYGTEESG